MKLNKILMLFAAVAAVSCSNEDVNEVVTADDGVGMTVIATAKPAPEARVNIADAGEKVHIEWNAGDCINAIADGLAEDLTSKPIAEGGETVVFEFENSLDATKDYTVSHNLELYNGGYNVHVNPVQTQESAGSLNTHTLALLGAATCKGGQENTVDFNVASAIARLKVYGGAADETVLRVAVKATGIANKHWYNTTNNNDGFDASDVKEVNVALTNSEPCNADITKASAKGIYVVVADGTYNDLQYAVATNKAIYTFAASEAVTYTAGYVKTQGLNLAKATAKIEYKLPFSLNFICGTSDWGAVSADNTGFITYTNYKFDNNNNKVYFKNGDDNYGVVDGKIAKIEGELTDANKISVGFGYTTTSINIETGEYTVDHTVYYQGVTSGSEWSVIKMNPVVEGQAYANYIVVDNMPSGHFIFSFADHWQQDMMVGVSEDKVNSTTWDTGTWVGWGNENKWWIDATMAGLTFYLELNANDYRLVGTPMECSMFGAIHDGNWDGSTGLDLTVNKDDATASLTVDVADGQRWFKIKTAAGRFIVGNDSSNAVLSNNAPYYLNSINDGGMNDGGAFELPSAGNYTITVDYKAKSVTAVKNN